MAIVQTERVAINLMGNFSVLAGSRDLTPRGARAKALIAILARTTDLRRNRRWIESRLWSDRDASQSSSSLRQTLVEIKQVLGEFSDVVQSNREHVWLDRDRLEIDLLARRDQALEAHLSGREFLEGLTIRDDAFEDWLRLEARSVEKELMADCPSKPDGDQACTISIGINGDLAPDQRQAVELCYQLLTRYFGAAVEFSAVNTAISNTTDN